MTLISQLIKAMLDTLNMYKITFDAGYACVSRARVSVKLETDSGHVIPDLVLRELLDSAINEIELFMTQTAVRFSLDSRTCKAFHKTLKLSCDNDLPLLSLEISVSEGDCHTHPVLRNKQQRELHSLFKLSKGHGLYAAFVERLQLELLQCAIEFGEPVLEEIGS